MEKVLIAGASGALGFEVLKILSQRNIPVRALIQQPEKEASIAAYTDDVFIADGRRIQNLNGLCENIDIVFSSIGKNISPFKAQSEKQQETDYICNRNVLHMALDEGVRRFVYTSIKGSDVAYNHQVAQVHHRIQNLLEKSSLSYTIFKPVDFFTCPDELLTMSKRGFIPVTGSGKARVNAIHPADLALVVANNLVEGPRVLEVGGPEIHSRNEIAEMIKTKIGARILRIPNALATVGIGPLSIFNKGLAAKLDYLRFVSTHDRIAAPHGQITFRQYLDELNLNKLS